MLASPSHLPNTHHRSCSLDFSLSLQFKNRKWIKHQLKNKANCGLSWVKLGFSKDITPVCWKSRAMKLCSGLYSTPLKIPAFHPGLSRQHEARQGMVSPPRYQAACSNRATHAARAASRLVHPPAVVTAPGLCPAGENSLKFRRPLTGLKKKITWVDLLAKDSALQPLSLHGSEMYATLGRGMGLEIRSRADTLDVLLPAVVLCGSLPDVLPYTRSTVDTNHSTSADSIFPSFSIKTILNRGAHKDNTPEAIKFLMSLTHPMHKNDAHSSLQGCYLTTMRVVEERWLDGLLGAGTYPAPRPGELLP